MNELIQNNLCLVANLSLEKMKINSPLNKLLACTSASKKVKSAERTGEGKLPYRSNSDQTATESLQQKLVNHP